MSHVLAMLALKPVDDLFLELNRFLGGDLARCQGPLDLVEPPVDRFLLGLFSLGLSQDLVGEPHHRAHRQQRQAQQAGDQPHVIPPRPSRSGTGPWGRAAEAGSARATVAPASPPPTRTPPAAAARPGTPPRRSGRPPRSATAALAPPPPTGAVPSRWLPRRRAAWQRPRGPPPHRGASAAQERVVAAGAGAARARPVARRVPP